MRETDLRLPDGRALHVYDTHPGDDHRVPVVWHHGTPNLGTPPAPLLEASDWLGLRWVSFDRPGYGGSTVAPGRTMESVARDAEHVADALGLGRFSVMGYSGGGSYALGCAATLGDRVQAVVSLAGIAPYGVRGLDWFGGMIRSGVTNLQAARTGRAARAALADEDYDPEFAPVDLALFDGPWGWLGQIAGPVALTAGPYGPIDDDVSYLLPWGCDPAGITAPVLLLHGGIDRIIPPAHGDWLAEHLPCAELNRYDADSHISILGHAESALDWLRDHADGPTAYPLS